MATVTYTIQRVGHPDYQFVFNESTAADAAIEELFFVPYEYYINKDYSAARQIAIIKIRISLHAADNAMIHLGLEKVFPEAYYKVYLCCHAKQHNLLLLTPLVIFHVLTGRTDGENVTKEVLVQSIEGKLKELRVTLLAQAAHGWGTLKARHDGNHCNASVQALPLATVAEIHELIAPTIDAFTASVKSHVEAYNQQPGKVDKSEKGFYATFAGTKIIVTAPYLLGLLQASGLLEIPADKSKYWHILHLNTVVVVCLCYHERSKKSAADFADEHVASFDAGLGSKLNFHPDKIDQQGKRDRWEESWRLYADSVFSLCEAVHQEPLNEGQIDRQIRCCERALFELFRFIRPGWFVASALSDTKKGDMKWLCSITLADCQCRSSNSNKWIPALFVTYAYRYINSFCKEDGDPLSLEVGKSMLTKVPTGSS